MSAAPMPNPGTTSEGGFDVRFCPIGARIHTDIAQRQASLGRAIPCIPTAGIETIREGEAETEIRAHLEIGDVNLHPSSEKMPDVSTRRWPSTSVRAWPP